LLELIWKTDWGASANNLKALVSRLRTKFEPPGAGHRFIENQRGVGYRFVAHPAACRRGGSGGAAPAKGGSPSSSRASVRATAAASQAARSVRSAPLIRN
jgi:DNA-binding winged helix-turn-helix (wHTH) protein